MTSLIKLQAGVGATFDPAVLQIYVSAKGQEVFDALTEAGIQTRRWYLPLLSEHPALSNCAVAQNEKLSVSEKLAEGLVGLPFHSFLSQEDVKKVCNVVMEVCCNE